MLHKRINSFCEGYRQNVALLGKGSESIHHLLEEYVLPRRHQGLTYLCLNPSYSDEYDIFRNLSYSLLAQVFTREDSLDALIRQAAGDLPRTAACIKEGLKRKRCSAGDIINLLNIFIEERDTRCVLIIEEFWAMEEVFARFFEDLAKFILAQKKCMVVVTASRIKEAERILGSQLHLLFGNFEVVSLDSVSLLDAYIYFTDCIKPLTIPPYCIGFFVYLLQSNIMYYRVLAEQIKKISHSDYDDIVINVIRSVLYERDSALFQRFANRIDVLKEKYPRDSRRLIKILNLMSRGYIRKNDIMFFSAMEKRKCTAGLQKLVELGYVETCGNIYRIADSMFSFWLSHIFGLYTRGQFIDKEKRIRRFYLAMREELALFKDDFYKERIQRIVELFSSFQNDTLMIEEQKMKFPLLRKTKVVPYPEEGLSLLVGEGDDLVLVGITEKDTSDADILQFLQKTTAVRNRNTRKIFISLGEPNSAARLIAKESKISLWDRHGLNALMQIYNKPVMV